MLRSSRKPQFSVGHAITRGTVTAYCVVTILIGEGYMCCSLLFCCFDKMDWNQLLKERVYLTYRVLSIIEESQDKHLRQEPRGSNWRKDQCCLLAFFLSLLSYLSVIAQAQSGLGSPTSISNQEDSSQTLQGWIRWRQSFNRGSLLPGVSSWWLKLKKGIQ